MNFDPTAKKFTNSDNTATQIGASALAGDVTKDMAAKGISKHDAMMTNIVHEGLHSTPGEAKFGLPILFQNVKMPNGKYEPYFQKAGERSSHQGPYDNAALKLLNIH